MRTFRLAPPIVFGTDCLSSFLWARRPDLITAVLGGGVLLPEQTVHELDNLRSTRYAWVPQMLEREVAAGAFQVIHIPAYGEVAAEYLALTEGKNGGRMGSGEAAALSYVRINGGSVASNNLSGVQAYCREYGLGLVGTEDILCLAVDQGRLDVTTAEALWAEMKGRRRSLPPYEFSEAYRRFESDLPR